VHSLVHVPTRTELLFQAPWGLQPPSAPVREGSDGHAFLERYAGGWQELFPSTNDPTEIGGVPIPFHGEVATIPWSCAIEDDTLVCSVVCRSLPLSLERRMALDRETLRVDERVVNSGSERQRFTWGHHLVFGPPFLEQNCRLETPAATIETIPEMWEKTARLQPGQRERWPHARLREGGTVDLRHVPGPEAGSHDDVYLTGLDDGWARVENPRLGLRVTLTFDATLFRWLISWQPYGGAQAMPLAGSYALGVEPWVTRLPLGPAAEQGEALELLPGAELRTSLTLTVEQVAPWQQ
jgi:galactose mutarotase-like enzyme